jgi:hypothetical protein
MTLASGTLVSLSYQEETTLRGSPEAGADMQALRTTGRALNLQKNTLKSEEVRSDRQNATLRHGFNQVVGSPGWELSLTAYNDFIEAAMSGDWAVIATDAAQTITAVGTSTTSVWTRSAGSYITDGFEIGMIVTAAGLDTGNNDQDSRITDLSALVMTVEARDGESVYSADTGDADEVITATGETVKIGTTLRTYTIERAFDDIAEYQVFNGCAINQMSLQMQPEQMVSGSFDILGMSADAMTQAPRDATITPAATNDPMAAFEGQLSEGGAESTVVTAMNFTLNNNRSLQAVVGSRFSPDVFEGIAMITGQATVFFEDATLFNKFVNETISTLSVQMDDLNGTDFIVIGFPAIKYTGGDMDPPSEGPVPIVMPWEAQVSALTSTSMYIQKSDT